MLSKTNPEKSVENPVFRKFIANTSKVEDPFIDQCKSALHDNRICASPTIDLQPTIEKIAESMQPTLQRTNSVMNPHFFEHPIKVDDHQYNTSDSLPSEIENRISTVCEVVKISPAKDSLNESAYGCKPVKPVKKERFRLFRCLK